MHHPSRDQLAAFAWGRLTGSGFGEVESHLEECESCLALLSHFSEDGFLAALRNAARPTPECAPNTADPPTVLSSRATCAQGALGGAAGELPTHPHYEI